MAAGGRHFFGGFFWGGKNSGYGSMGGLLVKDSVNSVGQTVASNWLFDTSPSGSALTIGTTTGPAVLLANITVSGVTGKSISIATTTGNAVLTANIKTKARVTFTASAGPATLVANLKTEAMLTVGTTAGPAVLLANVSVTGATSVFLTLGTTTGPALMLVTIQSSAIPDVVYLRVAAQDRRMGVNYNRFPIVIPFHRRAMQVEVSRLPMRVAAYPRLMRVA